MLMAKDGREGEDAGIYQFTNNFLGIQENIKEQNNYETAKT